MSQYTRLSPAKRALLERYLRGDVPRAQSDIGANKERLPADTAPLSFGQEQLWLLAQLVPDTLAYNECVTMHMPGPFDLATFRQSFQTFVDRHQAWRTTFPIVNAQPVQQIHAPAPINMPVIDLRSVPEVEREREAHRHAQAEARQPFDLANGPLFRLLLVQFSDTSHRLYLALHHIIFDGVSVYQVLLPELRAFYEAYLAGEQPATSLAPIEYTDYARWQRAHLSDEVLSSHIEFWRQQLAGIPLSLELPADHPRPPVQSFHGAMQVFHLSPPLTAALKDLSRQQGVTLYMVLMAAFATLLHRICGQEDIVIGTATAGRNRAELQRLVGYCLNTVALRIDASANPTFAELVQRVRATVLEAYEHEDIPFATVVQALQPARTPRQNPIFQIMFSIEPPLMSVAGGWTLTQMDVHISKAKFDLSIELDDRPEGLLGRFEYSTDLFDPPTIVRMVNHWQCLLEGIVATPVMRISELGLLSSAERRQILVDWNATKSDFPSDLCIHQLFEVQVERSPDAIALICGQRELTYGELNQGANQVAHRLLQTGAAPGDCIGVCMDRSLESVVAVLAILKIGAAYVPLDPTYPRERLAFMLHDTGARVLLTQAHLVSRVADLGTQVVPLDLDRRALADQPSSNITSDAGSRSRAYVMYTSGSTGQPKGVAVTHRNIARLVCGVGYAQLDAGRTLLHMAPLTFDASTFELWGALLHGARCVILPKWIPTLREIGDAIRQHGVTTLWLTASLFNAIIDEAPHILVGVRQLLTGGEALSVPHICRALDLLPGIQLINGYGPTETTTFACCFPIPRSFSSNARSVPIGRPIANTQVYVLDQRAQVVPVGVSGELYIGGAGVTEGYLNRPDLTAERFVPDMFCPDPTARLYRTGDIVRWLPDGTLDFIGRRDQQVKVRGCRIEPREVEVALKAHAGVREALVLAEEDQHASRRLVAYVVAYEGQGVTARDLREFLVRSLPQYMIPSTFALLDTLPTFASGKVDRRALLAAAPDCARQDATEAPAEPASGLHRLLIDMWSDLLGAQPIGITDSFFDLGGHSLLAARLIARLEQMYDVKIALAQFYANPTIEHLAHAWESQSEATPRSLLVPVQSSGSRPPLFFLHGDFNGGGYYCWNLARNLSPDQPLYALEPFGLDGGAIPATIESMAAEYVRLLRTVQATGPYRLGGYCNGALVAFEAARQLEAARERVDVLALIDVSTVNPWRRAVYGALAAIARLARQGDDAQLRWFLRLRRAYRRVRYAPAIEALVCRLVRAATALDGFHDRLGMRRKPASGAQDEPRGTESRLSEVWGRYGWATTRYRPRGYAGGIVLLLPQDGQQETPARAARRWQRVVSTVATDVIPGDHETCVTTYGHRLAAALSRYLGEQRRETTGTRH